MLGVNKHQYRHHLAVGKTAWTVAALLAWGVNKMFFSSGVKYLQNSSRMQKISIKFAVVIGVSIARICLYFIRNDTKNTSLLQLFEHFSYVELT